jgi:hypothetical protein
MAVCLNASEYLLLASNVALSFGDVPVRHIYVSSGVVRRTRALSVIYNVGDGETIRAGAPVLC